MKTAMSSSPRFATWIAVPGSTTATEPRGKLDRLGGVAQIERRRPLEDDEDLLLHVLCVPPATRAGRVAPDVGARLAQRVREPEDAPAQIASAGRGELLFRCREHRIRHGRILARDTVRAHVGHTDRGLASRADRRPARRGRDQALRPSLLARPADRGPGDGVHRRRRVRRRRDRARLRRRRGVARARPQPSLGLRGRDRRPERARSRAPRRRDRVPPARGLARGRLRRDLLRRARLVRALRARGSERARRGQEPGRGALARHRARASRLRARLRHRGRAGDRRHRVDLLALAGDRRIRVAGHRRCSGARGPRAVAALLPGLGPSLCRPEGPVRVRLTTTKEARCPSTSCCRA